MNILILTRGQGKIWLDAWQNKNHVGRLQVTTGIAGRQNFRTKPSEVRGQLEPVPEAEYNLGPLLWAGGQGNYQALWPNILSPIWVEIDRARAIGFHLDAGMPGTAGCVGFLTMQDLKTFVNWWNGYGPFVKLFVDWGLGYVKLPDLKPEPVSSRSGVTVQLGDIQHVAALENGRTTFTVDDLVALRLIKPLRPDSYSKEQHMVTLERADD